MKYDDASWHCEAENFPEELPQEAGATHTGMFVAWAFLAGLAGALHTEDSPEPVAKLMKRQLTPGAFFLEVCDGRFTDEDLNDEGNRFAADYFDFQKGPYLEDYAAALGEEDQDLYYIADTWDNFDRLKPVLDRRYADWKRTSA